MKKLTREKFRQETFKRDKFRCAMCGLKPDIEQLDAHHIVSRDIMPFGGYCSSNGITLCTDRCGKDYLDCHQKAEYFHATGIAYPGYTIDDLFAKINSSYEMAYLDSLSLELSSEKIDVIIGKIYEISKKETKICVELDSQPNQLTWELICESLGETDNLIIDFGKGRICDSLMSKKML